MNSKVAELKEKYQKGTRIILEHMGDDPRPIPDNTRGIVVKVDDIGTIHCIFEDHRCLGVIPGIDQFHIEEVR